MNIDDVAAYGQSIDAFHYFGMSSWMSIVCRARHGRWSLHHAEHCSASISSTKLITTHNRPTGGRGVVTGCQSLAVAGYVVAANHQFDRWRRLHRPLLLLCCGSLPRAKDGQYAVLYINTDPYHVEFAGDLCKITGRQGCPGSALLCSLFRSSLSIG